ncbi:putative nucleotidyltransferase substrate binding domain-containing protein [Solemya velum gill symbiont]|uniref:putative nucleotidyltransferase substrate binding domain-containing protein n=1 Tax=Solemya velum gill symbiont TaxID=2340 RepID=UPI0009965267|nr:putative nucleotidyltransferase substrate binding domain-containing protein [Solemya velum gill symbiont]OOY54561.1 cyclic nucleotide-binding protein [Solemya velum gill symbiont]OOY55099.1 cyclic nucleotide-binding protein [Solemya velum gill symbiont]OOY69956.1 cyclic nucleotide-binding protein [Solemya velum gill symbiont]OOY93549.1 cyclic nucleotide-binding protein [Solemya velum gill symbiont]
MEVELLEIRDFVASHPPFDALPGEALNELTPTLSIRYIRRGKEFPPSDASPTPLVYLVRRGAISLFDDGNKLLTKLGEGDLYGDHCVVTQESVDHGEATEDTLFYLVPCETMSTLQKKFPDFARFFEPESRDRLKLALERISKDPNGQSLANLKVRDLVKRDPICIKSDKTVYEAAKYMSEVKVSSLLISDDDNNLAGILTDRDIRSRLVAKGKPLETPVSEIMTSGILTINGDSSAFDALMMMTQEGIHHLPVTGDDGLLGMLTTTDLVRQESSNTVYLAGKVRKAKTLDDMIEASLRVPELQLHLVNAGGTAQHVGNAVTVVTDAFTKRLIKRAEEKFGPPPVPYAWIAAGSQARHEQSAHSDQDNGMIISDDMKPGDDEYFREVAKYVNAGLDKCGYIFCPGDVMASNEKWRQPKSVWMEYFHDWIWEPEPMALMLASIFFDMRVVHGDASLFEDIQSKMLEESQQNKLFLAYMAKNALSHRPPLGFFRNFVLVHDGEHDNTLDLKHSGIVPVTDLARLFVLAEGLPESNTIARLEAVAGTPSLSAGASADLVDAYEFISTLRVQHQARQIRNGEKPDNYVPPEEFSKLEREHLKDAFRVIHKIQESVSNRYGRLG